MVPTYIHQEDIKKETNQVQKRKDKYCTRKVGNKLEDILRISYDSQYRLCAIGELHGFIPNFPVSDNRSNTYFL